MSSSRHIVSPGSLKIPTAWERSEMRACGGVLGLEQVRRGPMDSQGSLPLEFLGRAPSPK